MEELKVNNNPSCSRLEDNKNYSQFSLGGCENIDTDLAKNGTSAADLVPSQDLPNK